MKRGVDVWPDYDETGRWCLRVKKARGKFTLDELEEIAMEYEQDFYAVIIKAVEQDMEQYFEYKDSGEFVTLYRATDFLEGRTT